MPTSGDFLGAISDRRVEVRFLPLGEDVRSSEAKSRFLLKPWLWQQLSSASRVLYFQEDTIICGNATLSINDFLKYDFVGAPRMPELGPGYDGSLSIRNPRLFLSLTSESDFIKSSVQSEDQWFYNRAKNRACSKGILLPSDEVARQFSVKTTFYETPLGYVNPQRWQAKRMAEIQERCPETSMLASSDTTT
jgi:hypothetical protein